jgi:uncharacterized protein (DUF427 family)
VSDHIRIRKSGGTWTIRAGGAVPGESRNALELTEGARAPVIYFPREDLAMALMDRSPTTSTCRWKGMASYFSISTGADTIADAAWSYETPKEEMEPIAGYLDSYPDKVTVEQL